MLSFWGAEISLFESPDHPPQFFLCVCLSFLHSFASLVNSIPGVLQEWGSPQPIIQAGYKVNYTFNSFFKRSHTNTYTYSHIQIHTGIQKNPQISQATPDTTKKRGYFNNKKHNFCLAFPQRIRGLQVSDNLPTALVCLEVPSM